MKKNKVRSLLCLFVMFVGLGFLIAGIFTIRSHKRFMKNAVPVTAEITDIQKQHDSNGEEKTEVYVTYRYDGVRYDHIRLGYYSSSMRKGQSLEVFCDTGNPRNIDTKESFLTIVIVFFTLGGIAFLLGSIFFCIGIKKRAAIRYGTALLASVEKIEAVTNPESGQKAYVVYCTYRNPDYDLTYRFMSDYVTNDPSWMYPVGSSITVMVNPNDYTRYSVKVEENG